jgi:hypothetical protein
VWCRTNKTQLAESDKPEDSQWNQVDDFKWLKAEQSPNWSVMPEEDRVGVDFWKTTVRGLSTDSVLDILRKAGLDTSKARA